MTGNRHKWVGHNIKKTIDGGVLSCLKCGCVKEYVRGKVSYFYNDTVYDKAPACKPQTPAIPKLTPAQEREYENLKKHKSTWVGNAQRRKVLDKLVEIGLAVKDGSYNWFHLKN